MRNSKIGLSPLARGTRATSSRVSGVGRFIPAGAGNTTRDNAGYSRKTVYPRWRGEHGSSRRLTLLSSGLSPLARGTHQQLLWLMHSERFIPAGAGNTHAGARLELPFPVYPRWRGEHVFSQPPRICAPGLSPLARGTRMVAGFRLFASRFIPAGAGNTPVDIVAPRLTTVYPRWRGEHSIMSNKDKKEDGLSPLARGTQYHPQPALFLTRFIPAGAGNTGSLQMAMLKISVYPRWRGEHARLLQISTIRYRFIPAGAGNTPFQRMNYLSVPVYPRWRGEHAITAFCQISIVGLSPLARGTLQ